MKCESRLRSLKQSSKCFGVDVPSATSTCALDAGGNCGKSTEAVVGTALAPDRSSEPGIKLGPPEAICAASDLLGKTVNTRVTGRMRWAAYMNAESVLSFSRRMRLLDLASTVKGSLYV